MQFKMAHLRHPARSGGTVNFAVFAARANSGMDSDNARLLAQLTAAARAQGLRVDQSALAYDQGGRIRYYGTPTLVDFLAKNGVSHWTHTIEI